MPPDEIYQHHLARGPALKQLARAFADPRFQEMPVSEQHLLIQKVYEKIGGGSGKLPL